MKTRLKIIIIGIVVASIVFGTYQSIMYTCGTMSTFMDTPREPTLWKCLDIWKHQSEQPQPQRILPDSEPTPEPEITSRYEKYLDENNELNFALQYDKNGVIIDDLQRIFDWCDYTGEKPAHWYFDWNNQTHHIDSTNCQWEQTWDGYSQPFGKQNEN